MAGDPNFDGAVGSPSGCREMTDSEPSVSPPYGFTAYRAFSTSLYGAVNKFNWDRLWLDMDDNKRRAWAECAAAVTNRYQSVLDSDAGGVK